MRTSLGVRKSVAVLATAATVLGVFFAVERPWFLRWGAAPEEITAARPGDERVPVARDQATRAVTVHATADQVWPWIAQLGQDRGGFYSYEVLEDLVGCEMPRAEQILPQHQQWRAGDRLWMYPPDKAGGMGNAPLVACEPGRHLVFAIRQLGTPPTQPEDGVWGFVLEPAGAGSTRLIAWSRAAGETRPLFRITNRLLFEPAHYVMERRTMLNVKALAEGRVPQRWTEVVTVVLWTLTVALLIVALVEVARRRMNWGRALAVAGLSGFAFQFLTLAQPPVLVSVLIVVALAATLKGGGAVPRPLRIAIEERDLPWSEGRAAETA
jgi:hypothetical protein